MRCKNCKEEIHLLGKIWLHVSTKDSKCHIKNAEPDTHELTIKVMDALERFPEILEEGIWNIASVTPSTQEITMVLRRLNFEKGLS